MSKNILIALAWPYVNGDIHIGHLAGYLLPADIVARFQRIRGNKVLMVSGSDCYGTPITVQAEKEGITPNELVNQYHPKTKKLFEDLEISYDLYTKTTTENHTKVVQNFFIDLYKNGLVTTGKTKQYYSESDKRFLPDRYVEGTCPRCGAKGCRSDQCDSCGYVLSEGELKFPIRKDNGSNVELKETEHYFLDYSKAQGFLEEYVQSKAQSWRPWILAETKKWLKEGLRKRAVTRDLTWGVPIPKDDIEESDLVQNVDEKRLYVWFDAVIGYYSASTEWASGDEGRSIDDYWYNSESKHYYFMGKDNLVFHTLFWPAMLKYSDPDRVLPDVLAINHYLTLEGEKFSKSRGITADPLKIADEYGLDNLRFYIATIMPENSDSNFSFQGLKESVNGKLVAKIGNFINRVLTLVEGVPFVEFNIDSDIVSKVEEANAAICANLDKAEVKSYVEQLLALSEFANGYITESAPWSLRKEGSDKYDLEKYHQVMHNCMYLVAAIGLFMSPLMIKATPILESMLGISFNRWSDEPHSQLIEILQKFNVGEKKPLFTKIDSV